MYSQGPMFRQPIKIVLVIYFTSEEIIGISNRFIREFSDGKLKYNR
jgi:hypothetical protein